MARYKKGIDFVVLGQKEARDYLHQSPHLAISIESDGFMARGRFRLPVNPHRIARLNLIFDDIDPAGCSSDYTAMHELFTPDHAARIAAFLEKHEGK